MSSGVTPTLMSLDMMDVMPHYQNVIAARRRREVWFLSLSNEDVAA